MGKQNVKFCCFSDLEEALLLLPFTSVCELLSQLPALIERGFQTELVCRTMIFLFRVHHKPIVNNQALLPVVGQLQKLALSKVNYLRVSNINVPHYVSTF
jgi:U3 small nucleolar RNA-associated protein 12